MTTPQPDARLFDFSLLLPASPEIVFRALTDAAELRRWFPLDARVNPGAGGSIWLSWGPTCEGEAPITIWEPGHRVQWTEDHDGGAVKVAIDMHLEPAAGGEGTVLRLVQSGFGKGAKWEDYYDSIESGWKFELRSLRHYLAHHRGKERRVAWSIPCAEKAGLERTWAATWTSLAPDDAWRMLMGPRVMGGPEAARLSRTGEGEPFELNAATGDVIRGRAVLNYPPHVFVGTVEGALGDGSDLERGFMRVMVERNAGKSAPYVWFSAWGIEESPMRALQERFDRVLTDVFGPYMAGASSGSCGGM